ncbi:hypothetical protein [Natronoglycomyces albus]|uniref:Lipoprotein n=1 Tax=Natronoglycomyces albus TaxID=2811108 RepID=A0A895XKL2_9ACTN|nr:hypothetical protein [Natronoglycomyces albus]QSB05874.1 hypothetical protein JQS30_02810 [Natronoglycomyces albus]
MSEASRLTGVALAVLALLVASGCATDNGDSDTDTGSDGLPGLPAMSLTELEPSCDMFLEEQLRDFFGYVEWSYPPVESPYGSGTSPSAITCEGTVVWPEFELSSGRTNAAEASLFTYLWPLEPVDEASKTFQARVEFMVDYDEGQGRTEFFAEESPEGAWDQANLYAHGDDHDWYLLFLQQDDFVLEISFRHEQDPGERRADLSQGAAAGEWSVFDFDRESASQFLIEDYMPAVHENFLTLLDRTE